MGESSLDFWKKLKKALQNTHFQGFFRFYTEGPFDFGFLISGIEILRGIKVFLFFYENNRNKILPVGKLNMPTTADVGIELA